MFNELTNEEMVNVDGGSVIITIGVILGVCLGGAITGKILGWF